MTPQQIEAMKLALEALELINIEFVCGNGSHHKKEDRHEWDEDCPITNRWRKAITAIREALEQPEHEPVVHDPLPRACNLAGVDYQTFLKIKAYMPVAPPQPEQEPVIGRWRLREVYFDEDGEPISHRSPPQRKPLTDEEIDKLLGPFPRYADEWLMTDFIRFARAIEAAHGIKENT